MISLDAPVAPGERSNYDLMPFAAAWRLQNYPGFAVGWEFVAAHDDDQGAHRTAIVVREFAYAY